MIADYIIQKVLNFYEIFFNSVLYYKNMKHKFYDLFYILIESVKKTRDIILNRNL